LVPPTITDPSLPADLVPLDELELDDDASIEGVGSDQMTEVALSLFGALSIRIDDDYFEAVDGR
jgi:hypothetical protein